MIVSFNDLIHVLVKTSITVQANCNYELQMNCIKEIK